MPKASLFTIRRSSSMSNVDAPLKDGNLNDLVVVLVAVPNPSSQKPPLHPMSLPATSEVAEEGFVEEDEAAVVVVVLEVVSKGAGEGLAEVIEEDSEEGMTEEALVDEAVSEEGSKIEATVVLVGLVNKADLAVREAQVLQVDMVDKGEGTVVVVAVAVAASGKFSCDTQCASLILTSHQWSWSTKWISRRARWRRLWRRWRLQTRLRQRRWTWRLRWQRRWWWVRGWQWRVPGQGSEEDAVLRCLFF